MNHRAARPRNLLLALLLVVPLIVGAVVTAAVNLQPGDSWAPGGEAAGAPVAGSAAGIDPADLVDARRAASEAGSQASFLSTGTGELSDGTGQLRDGAGELASGVDDAKTGAQELHDGLVQLQSATGQLGAGATRVADGVGSAVDQVLGLGAVQGQILTAIDDIDGELAESDYEGAGELRDQLAGFRDQVEAADLEGSVTDQLTQLKEGSREIANQLAVPGYGFHDGIYSATDGARRLNEGLGALQGGVDEAVTGVNDLDDGAQRIDQMAERNQDKLTEVQRSLPAGQAPAESGGVQAAAESEPMGQLLPMYALLLGALAALGGVAVGFLGRGRRLDLVLGGAGVVALTGVLFALLGQGLTVGGTVVAVGVLALMTAASTGLTLLARRVAGDRWGGMAAMVGAIIQVGLVGWVWQAAASADVGTGWQVIAALTPLHHVTGALSAAGNAGDPTLIWLGGGVLAAVAVLSFVVLGLGRREAAAGGTAADGERATA